MKKKERPRSKEMKKKCWAGSLNDCNGKISREHIITKALSEEELTISGFPWMSGIQRKMRLYDLCSHILCEKHNTDLSKFDSEVVNLQKIFEEITLQEKRFAQPGFGYRNNADPIVYRVNGHYLERWFCKTLVNVVMVDPTYKDLQYQPILEYIYGDKNFEEPYGLYTDATIGQMQYLDFLSVLPIFGKPNNLTGACFIIKGVGFRLQIPSTSFSIAKLDEDRFITDFDINGNLTKKQLNWHNKKIQYAFNGKVRQTIVFEWKD